MTTHTVRVNVPVERWDDETYTVRPDFTLQCDAEVSGLENGRPEVTVLRIASHDGDVYYGDGQSVMQACDAIGDRNQWSAIPFRGSWFEEVRAAAVAAAIRIAH